MEGLLNIFYLEFAFTVFIAVQLYYWYGLKVKVYYMLADKFKLSSKPCQGESYSCS
jgi:hypothetical protein